MRKIFSPPADLLERTLELSRVLRRTLAQGQRKDGQGVSALRLHALSFLADRQPMSMCEFAATMNVSPSTATAFVDRLVRSGLVARIADQRNRRKVFLRLTAAGRQSLIRDTRRRKQTLSRMFSTLSSADRTHLERILRILLQK